MFSLLAALLPLFLASCTGHQVLMMGVGTYSDGFYTYRLDARTGKVVSKGVFPKAPGAFAKAPMPNPSYLTYKDGFIYAVSEMPDSTAAVEAWRFDGRCVSAAGSQLTGMPSGGEDPCYVAAGDGHVAVEGTIAAHGGAG